MQFPRLEREVKVGVGICMDINMKDFEQARYNETALADYTVANDN